MFKKALIYISILCGVLIGAESCTPKNMLIYFQNENQNDSTTIKTPKETNYHVKSGDNLYIEVLSVDEDVSNIYNGRTEQMSSSLEQSLLFKGYLVSPDGYISFPFHGEIMVKGKTLQEVEQLVSKSINIEQTEVIVRLVNRSISIIGEVRDPGKYDIIHNQISIYEAISLAGDINDYGNRTVVTVIHKNNDETEIRKIDLTDGTLLASEASQIYPNDIVYVEPIGSSYGHKTMNVPLAISTTASVIAIIVAITAL